MTLSLTHPPCLCQHGRQESAIRPACASTADRNPQSDWLTVDEAATLTGRSIRRWQQLAERAFHRSLARKGPLATGRGKPVWWVHRSLDRRLAISPDRQSRQQRARAALRARFPADHVDVAYKKAHYLARWRALCETPRPAGVTDADMAARVVAEARAAEERTFKISVRTLQTWHRAYNALGPDGQILGVAALVPRWHDGGRPVARSPEAIEWFYSIYHAQSRLSCRFCHDATLAESRKRGWSWPAAYTATTRWLRENDLRDMTCLHRDGARAYSHRFMPHTQTDWDAIEPGAMYVADHTQCDFWCVYRDSRIRPWLTAVQDMRSRMIVGWQLGPTPHSDAIAAAFRMAFRDHAIPEHMRIDNGKDFCSKFLTGLTKTDVRRMRREFGPAWKETLRRRRENPVTDDPRWTGLVHELDIKLIHAIPYAAWSKGTVERWFRTFEDQCGKTFITYCGNSPGARPECLDQILTGPDVPTMEAARDQIAAYLGRYHRTVHRGDGMDKRTPLQVWATATRLRRADPDALAFLMTIRGAYKVGGNGVTVTIGSARIGYGARCPALRRLAGRDVLVAVDPQRVCEAFAFDAKTRRLIARLEPNQRIHPCATSEDAREAIAQEQRGRKPMRQAQRTAARRARTAAQRINAHVREQHRDLLATGTDDATPNLVPVRTGFEGLSIPDRLEPLGRDACGPDGSDLADFFADETEDATEAYEDSGLEDLFEDSVDTEIEDAESDLDGLL